MAHVLEHLKKLKKSLKLSFQIEEKKDAVYPFVFNDKITVYVQDLDPGLYMWSVICPCPDKKKEDIFIHLMSANLLGQATGGFAIGLDNKEKFLTLSCNLSYELNYQEFKENIEDFINFLLYWREEIDKISKKESIY